MPFLSSSLCLWVCVFLLWSGLTARDRRTLEAALKKGRKKIPHGRIIVIGPGRSGKTALIRSLQEKSFEPTFSTIGIDVGKVSCIAQSKGKSLLFKADPSEQMTFRHKVMFAYDAVQDLIKQQKDRPLQPATNRYVALGSPSAREDPPRAAQSPPEEYSTEINCTKQVLTKFIEELWSSKALDKGMLEAMWYFDLWDFAGQQPFEALQHMFLGSARCAYLIVFDATKLLAGEYFDEFHDASGESRDVNQQGSSYFRAFESWLNIVQQVVGDDNDIPVYAVGTHTDQFPEAERIQELQRVEDFIWKAAQTRAYFQILRKVFFVDNTRSGSMEEDPEVDKVRHELVECMEQHCNVEIPLAWIPFVLALEAISSQFEKHILPLGSVRQIASTACQDNEVDITGLLSYYQHLGHILQFNKTQSSDADEPQPAEPQVVIDTDWMMKAAAVLFTPQPLKCQDPSFRKEYKLLFDEGILLESLAIHRWSLDDAFNDLCHDKEQRQVVFGLLSQFDLLYDTGEVFSVSSRAESRKYLVPALVTRPAEAQSSFAHSIRTPPYYIVCAEGQLFPQVLFWCSLVRLANHFKSREKVLLFRGRARLLVCSEFWLEMSLFDKGLCIVVEGEQCDTTDLATACRSVLNHLSSDLCKLRDLSLRNIELAQAVRCECSGDGPCHEHKVPMCQNINCFHFARLPLPTEVVLETTALPEPPIFRCRLDLMPKAVVDHQDEMFCFWLPEGAKVVGHLDRCINPVCLCFHLVL